MGEIFDEFDDEAPRGAPVVLRCAIRDRRRHPASSIEERFDASCPPRVDHHGCRSARRAGRTDPGSRRSLHRPRTLQFDVVQASPTGVERVLIRPGASAALLLAPPSPRIPGMNPSARSPAHAGSHPQWAISTCSFFGRTRPNQPIRETSWRPWTIRSASPSSEAAAAPSFRGSALLEMPDEEHAEETLVALRPSQAGEIVERLPDDEAADLVGALDPADQERILAEVETGPMWNAPPLRSTRPLADIDDRAGGLGAGARHGGGSDRCRSCEGRRRRSRISPTLRGGLGRSWSGYCRSRGWS